MKRLIFLMLPLLAAMLLGSCRGDDGPMGPEGPAGPAGKDGEGLKTLDFDFTVNQNDWEAVTDTDEPYYRCSFDKFEELDKAVIDHGIVAVYRVLDDGYYGALPTVQLHKAKNDKNEDIFYTQLIDYEFAPGLINFYVTSSDFYMDEKPDQMKFRVVVNYY